MNDYQAIRQRIEERSREKLRKRKQKRFHILTVCIPLVLCISLGGIYAWQACWLDRRSVPQTDVTVAGIPETEAVIWYESIEEGLASEELTADQTDSMHSVTMELTNGEIVTAYADSNLLYLVNTELESIMTRSMDNAANEFTEEQDDSDAANGGYRLKIFGKGTREYILQDGCVTDVKTGSTYRATQLQWQTLCGLLGIREE